MALKSTQVKVFGALPRYEYVANAAITPGMLIEMMSTGLVRAHASAGQAAEKMFAFENELEGEAMATAYAAADRVQCDIYRPGDVVRALLANGETAVIGSKLESNGDGYLKVYAVDSAGAVEYPSSIVAVALEALDMSDSSGADPSSQRISARIM